MENLLKQKNDAESSILEEQNMDFTFFFCPFCLSYPCYSIQIKDNGEILLTHICKNNHKKENTINEIKSYKSFVYKCKYCEKNCQNICLKCDAYICDNCSNDHNYSSQNLSKNNSIRTIINSQYYCKEHFLKFTNYCSLCKIHLCDKECLTEHYHINCYSLYDVKNYQKFEINYKGDNKTFIRLSLIAKFFNDCYSECLNKKIDFKYNTELLFRK